MRRPLSYIHWLASLAEAGYTRAIMTCCSQRPYLWLFALLAGLGFAADQASKYVVFAKLYPDERSDHEAQVVISGLFDLRTNYTLVDDAGDRPLSFLRTLGGTR